MDGILRFHVLLRLALVAIGGIVTSASGADENPVLVLNSSGHTAYIRDVLFADAGTVVSSSYDGTVREWDVNLGQTTHIYRGELGEGSFGEVHGAALTPDRRFLLTGGWFHPDENGPHEVRIYDRATRALVHVIHGHQGPVRAIAVSPDGRFVATGDYRGLVYLWTMGPDGRLTQINGFQGHQDRVTRIAFAQAGPPRLVSIGYDKLIRFWSYEGGQLKFITTGQMNDVDARWWIAPHPSQPLVAICGYDTQLGRAPIGQVAFFSTDGEQRGTPLNLEEGAGSIAFSPDGSRLVVGTGYPASTSSAFVYAWPTLQRLVHYRDHDRTVAAIAFSPDGRRIASVAGGSLSVHVWEAATGQTLRILGSPTKPIWSVGFSDDGTKLLWGSHLFRPDDAVPDHEINLRGELEWSFDLTTLAFRSALPLIGQPGTRYFTGQRGLLQHAGREIKLIRDQQGTESIAITPGGRPFVTGRQHDKIFGLTFLPSSPLPGGGVPVLIAGGFTLQVYDGLTGRPGVELFGHRGQVNAVAPSPTHPYAATAGEDKTVRLWNVQTGELLLSLFHEGGEWVAWTPTGHYASSPRGERLIGWQINKGDAALPDFFDGTQFHETLYKPDVLRALLGTGSVATAIAAAGGVQVTVQKVLPPLVELVTPTESKIRLTDGQLKLTARGQTRQEENALTSLTLYMDGRPFEGRHGRRTLKPNTTGPVTESWAVTVPPGEHVFTVRGSTAKSHTDSSPIHVNFESNIQTDRKLYVLGIGIAAYEDSTIDRLFYADKDAQQMCHVLADHGQKIFREIKTRPLVNSGANKKAILDGLKWLKDEMTENDIGVVLYSGHGAVDQSFGGFFFLPADIDDEQISDRGISADFFKRALAEIPGRLVVLLDACHAGAVGSGGLPSQALNEDMIHSLTNEQPGIDVICSTDGQSISAESHDLEHGYFSYVVLEGLKGEANNRRFDTVVTNLELQAYVDNRLKQITSSKQVPQIGSSNVTKAIPLTEDRSGK
ncbi:MAG: caspase family protein [Planctomycetaceae bacterium]|nr:caspase family protein [Planctomycetaceae bacterium]